MRGGWTQGWLLEGRRWRSQKLWEYLGWNLWATRAERGAALAGLTMSLGAQALLRLRCLKMNPQKQSQTRQRSRPLHGQHLTSYTTTL